MFKMIIQDWFVTVHTHRRNKRMLSSPMVSFLQKITNKKSNSSTTVCQSSKALEGRGLIRSPGLLPTLSIWVCYLAPVTCNGVKVYTSMNGCDMGEGLREEVYVIPCTNQSLSLILCVVQAHCIVWSRTIDEHRLQYSPRAEFLSEFVSFGL